MTVQKKALGRAGTAEMTLRPKTKSATADELVGTVLDKHFPTPATSSSIAGGGRASRKLTPMDAATVTKRLSVGSTESSATHSMSSGVPVAHPNSARTKGVLPPTAPKSRRSRPCPVKRRASADEVYGLDTRSLASLWRTRGGSEEDLATKDNESEGEDELPMTKAVSDMPRSEAIKILPPSTALTVDPDKLAQQKQIVEFILSDDLPGATSSMAISATQSGHSTGMSVEQEKSLARRRRSFELQALIIEGEVTEKTQMEVSGIQTVDVQDTALIKSREEKYWQNMWHMAKSARNDEKDVEDGDDPFELEGVEIGLVHPY